MKKDKKTSAGAPPVISDATILKIIAYIHFDLKKDELIKAKYFLDNVFAEKIETKNITDGIIRDLKVSKPFGVYKSFEDDIEELKLALQRVYLDKLENPRESSKKISGFAKANVIKKYEKEIENYFSQFLIPEKKKMRILYQKD